MIEGNSREIRPNSRLNLRRRVSSKSRIKFVCAIVTLTMSLISFIEFPVAFASAGTDVGTSSNGASMSLPLPPAGFDPVTATSAELAEYGLSRPSGGPALALWDTELSKVKHWESPNPVPGTFSINGPLSASATNQNGFTSYNNSNWAGHQVPISDYGNVNFDYTEADWTVPVVPSDASYPISDCKKGTAPLIGVWDGLGGNIADPSGDIIQDGIMACSASTPQYLFWTQNFPGKVDWIGPPIAPGDQVFTEVNYNGNETTTYLLENVTTGVGMPYPNLPSPSVDLSTAEFILEHPGGSANPLPDFGVVDFSSCYFENTSGDIYELTSTNNIIQMNEGSGTTLTGGVSGGGFSVTWKSGT